MKKILFEGCATAICTPFTEFGVNFEEFGHLLDFQIEQGIDALVVCGTTGESATMTDRERKETFDFAVKRVAKRVPVIIGTGSNCTASAIELTKYAGSIGADGALVVTPYYNKATRGTVLLNIIKKLLLVQIYQSLCIVFQVEQG